MSRHNPEVDIMPHGVARHLLGNFGPSDSFFYRPLNHGLVKMMTINQTVFPIAVGPCRWKDPLPGPLVACARILFFKGSWQLDTDNSVFDISFMTRSYLLKMMFKTGLSCRRQNCLTIFIAFPFSHRDLSIAKIDIFDTESQAFEKSKPGSVHEHDCKPIRTFQMRQNHSNLLPLRFLGYRLGMTFPDRN